MATTRIGSAGSNVPSLQYVDRYTYIVDHHLFGIYHISELLDACTTLYKIVCSVVGRMMPQVYSRGEHLYLQLFCMIHKVLRPPASSYTIQVMSFKKQSGMLCT
jgi:hypothetical protein